MGIEAGWTRRADFSSTDKTETLEAKRQMAKQAIAQEYGMSVEELDAFKGRPTGGRMSGTVNGVEVSLSTSFGGGGYEFHATVGGQNIDGDAAQGLYHHFSAAMRERDNHNRDISEYTYDAHQRETLGMIAKVVGGEEKARKILDMSSEQGS